LLPELPGGSPHRRWPYSGCRTRFHLRAELCFSQTKDGREHDRVEEPNGKDAPHRYMALKSIEAVTNAPATIAQRASRYWGLKRCRSPAPRKRRAWIHPEERDKACRSLGRRSRQFRASQNSSPESFRSKPRRHIGENANCAEEEIGMFPDGVLPHICGAAGRVFNLWQPGTPINTANNRSATPIATYGSLTEAACCTRYACNACG